MAGAFALKLVTPTGVLFDGAVEQVTAVGPLGEFGVLAEHADLITSLVPGVLTIRAAGGATKEYLLAGGLAEVRGGAMTILATAAEPPERVDTSSAEADLKAAEERLAVMSSYQPEYAEAYEALLRARARLEVDARRRAVH